MRDREERKCKRGNRARNEIEKRKTGEKMGESGEVRGSVG